MDNVVFYYEKKGMSIPRTVARTIADGDRFEHIREKLFTEAIQSRELDRRMG